MLLNGILTILLFINFLKIFSLSLNPLLSVIHKIWFSICLLSFRGYVSYLLKTINYKEINSICKPLTSFGQYNKGQPAYPKINFFST